MNGIEKIIQRIDADVQTGIDELLSEARENAARITASCRAQADELAAGLAKQNEKAAASRKEHLLSVSQMETRKVTLSVRQEMVDAAFSQALSQLCSLPDGPYTDTVVHLLLHAAPDGRGCVIFSETDRARIGAAAVAAANRTLGDKGRLTLAEETRPLRGGFLLVNGSVEVNCSFETLIRLARSEISGEAAKRLFPGA